MSTVTKFDQLHALVRALAFADLYPEPEDNPFWNFEKELESKSLPMQIQWMQYTQGRYSKILSQVHEERYEDAFRLEQREEADRAISKATKYLERYLAKHLPEAYLELQAYETIPDFVSKGDDLVDQFKGLTDNSEVPKLVREDLYDRPQITKGQMAALLSYSERYVDELVVLYDAFPRPIRRLPGGNVYFWLDEALKFKAGKLYQELERERNAKMLDKSNPEEGLAKFKPKKRSAKRKS